MSLCGPVRCKCSHLTIRTEAFPRSKTIAFNDGDDGFDHDRGMAGMATGREGGYLSRSATHRSQADGEISPTLYMVFADCLTRFRSNTSHWDDIKLS